MTMGTLAFSILALAAAYLVVALAVLLWCCHLLKTLNTTLNKMSATLRRRPFQ
ncbi:MAG: hypothetical protein JWO78_184 [Micavibrio sp.]|nr:hypothetical protein [Micavibrio sp.]